jgi:uncharacterized protein YydD (DUF2326 family)
MGWRFDGIKARQHVTAHCKCERDEELNEYLERKLKEIERELKEKVNEIRELKEQLKNTRRKQW